MIRCYGENRISVFGWLVPAKVGPGEDRMFAPGRIVERGAGKFFVRVNRFWCVWTRVLVFVLAWHEFRPGAVAMGCLTQSWWRHWL
jgi:hypothetical protein